MLELVPKILLLTALMVGAMFAAAWAIDRVSDWVEERWGRRRP